MVDKELPFSKDISRREFLRRVVRGGGLAVGVLLAPTLLAGCSGSQPESQSQTQSFLAPAAPTSAALKEQYAQTAPKVIGTDPFSWAEFFTGDYLDTKGVQFGHTGDGIKLDALSLWVRNHSKEWKKMHLGNKAEVYDKQNFRYDAQIYGEDLRGNYWLVNTSFVPDIPPMAAVQMVVFANIPEKRELAQIRFTATNNKDSSPVKITAEQPVENMSLFASPGDFPATKNEYSFQHDPNVRLTYKLLSLTDKGDISLEVSGENKSGEFITLKAYNQGMIQLWGDNGKWAADQSTEPDLKLPPDGTGKTSRIMRPAGWSWQNINWPMEKPAFPQLMRIDKLGSKEPMLFKISK